MYIYNKGNISSHLQHIFFIIQDHLRVQSQQY